MARSVQRAYGCANPSYDLLAPASRYKTEWTNTLTHVYDFAAPANLKGRLYLRLYLQKIRPMIRFILNHTPGFVRLAINTLREKRLS